MMIDPSILMGVSVPVFALTWDTPRRFVAWNDRMVAVTGRAADAVIGAAPEVVFGGAAAVLQNAPHETELRLVGLGSVIVRRQGSVLVCTVSDHEREMFIGLAAQDLKTPLRTIHGLADDAAREGVAPTAALDRIKRIARQGMSLTRDVVSCAEAGRRAGVGHRKVHLPSLADALMIAAAPEAGHQITTPPITVLVERGVLQSALRALIDHAVARAGPSGARLDLQVTPVGEAVQFTLLDRNQGLGAPARRFLSGGAFRGDEGFGLLGVRRLLRARGGGIAITKLGPDDLSAIVMRLPGCVLSRGRGADVV